MTFRTRAGVLGAGLALTAVAVTRAGAVAPPHVVVTGQMAVRERATSTPVTSITGELLEKVPTGRKFDQILAQLPESRDVQPGYLPDGWKAEQSGRNVRLFGPAIDQVRFRLDISGSFADAYVGKAGTLQSSYLNTKDEPLKITFSAWPKVEKTPDLEGILTLPPQGSPGQPMLIGVANGYRDGQWQLTTNGGSIPLIPVDQFKNIEVIKSVLARPEPRPFITTFPEMGAFIGARYTDPYGEVTVDAPLSITPATAPSGSRWLSTASALTFAGQAACVGGRFPKLEDAYGLLLDKRTALEPWGASPTAVMVGIPDNVTPGPHTISTADGSSSVTVGILKVEGSLDQNKLWRGESTTMRLRVLGTDKQFPLAVLNRSPDVIGLDGGVRQVVTTPGGADNAITRGVHGIHRGNFTIVYSVNAAGCGG